MAVFAVPHPPSDQSIHPYLSTILDFATQKVLATASVRVYCAVFNKPHLNWKYSELKGILVFGRDREVDVVQGRADRGTRTKERYWFKLVDTNIDRVVWVYSIPEVFEYSKDMPFFHYFSGKTRMFGFRFDEDPEAANMYQHVVDRTRRHFFGPLSSRGLTDRPRSRKTKPISPAMISGPQPNSCIHVSHVGISPKGVIEASQNIDPSWTKLIADLQGYGVGPDVVRNNQDFVEGFLAGARSTRDKQASSSPPAAKPLPQTPSAPARPAIIKTDQTKHKIPRKAVKFA
ncbi:hypothetical protein CONPUDRAFT_166414 [Coniophora puteana RWD-64-598 SS2]|uniref:WH1 domain-containing protein n=1 Tax=Coniophora puteana (strain RWD-64-598) TaxID=741705 RepID=A0A5M3MLL7_CONPW|nr:uncharacterized protein CONPUDRAFT_166414 [Coniophora puteana RWD-64-598 SS2]EIW79684.1 hypothetical protein CONPUDRAFT_166414 [Coniophora puteana RWD-64-598 SS2]